MAKQTRKSIKPSSATIVIPEIPVHITIEIIIRNEFESQLKINKFKYSEEAGGYGCPDNKFSYSFDKENASVLSLSVEEFEKDNPGDSGDFTTCINDASLEPKVRVVGLAKVNNPGGRVALTLKFLGKDVFNPAKEFTISENGFLKLNTLVKLPIS